VSRFVKLCYLFVAAMIVMTVPAMAQEGGATIDFTKYFGAGLVMPPATCR